MDRTKQKIVLAALLHDIGKFWQRGDSLLNSSQHVSRPGQEWDWLVPYNNNRPGYQHAIWTYQFFENNKAVFNSILGPEESASIANVAGKHHKPDNYEEALIQMADCWSSAIDRRQQFVDEEESNLPETERKVSWGRYAYKKIPLHSIFDDIKVGDQPEDAPTLHQHVFKLKAISLDDQDIFPVPLDPEELEQLKSKGLEEDYRRLWTQFEDEFEHLPKGSFNGFLVSLVNLLKKYTWCIPSSTIDVPNVSLFEHLKTTAAFASCLFDYFASNPNALKAKGKSIELVEDTDPVLMCCLDLSGIQQFIYDIASKKAFQSLKGRSFYLQLLLDQLLQRILYDEQIRQSIINIIYSSGGKAYFLLPNNDAVIKRLEEINSEIQAFLWEEHKGKIYAALGYASFRYEFDAGRGLIKSVQEPKVNNLGDLWRQVSELAATQKRKRFRSLLLDNFEAFFDENSATAISAQEIKTCKVTGEPILGEVGNIGDEKDKIEVLPAVEEQTNLGKALKDFSYLMQYRSLGNSAITARNRNGVGMAFGALQQHVWVTDDIRQSEVARFKSNNEYEAQFTVLNDTSFLDVTHKSDVAGYGFTFYGGNKQPIIADEKAWGGNRLKTLEELCNKSDESGDIQKMGVLRMDVDNLGQIFIKGFDEQNKSFAAYSTLSFQLELFFSGYINTIQDRLEKKDHLSILYSGGDDVFAVGRWDAILEFAEKIRREFGRFTGRKDLSISAGIAIVDRKYPIYKAAEIAGDVEKEAKEYDSEAFGKKNAICFFDEAVSWNVEFDEVKRLKNNMVRFINQKERAMSRALLHQLQLYKALKDFSEKINKEKEKDFSYKWHSAYYLKRFSERYDKEPAIADFVMKDIQARLLHDEVFGADRFLDLAALAARWAEYELKLTNKTSEHGTN